MRNFKEHPSSLKEWITLTTRISTEYGTAAREALMARKQKCKQRGEATAARPSLVLLSPESQRNIILPNVHVLISSARNEHHHPLTRVASEHQTQKHQRPESAMKLTEWPVPARFEQSFSCGVVLATERRVSALRCSIRISPESKQLLH